MLLRRIVEVTAETSSALMIRDRIVRPLGLHRMFVAESRDDLAQLAPATSRALVSDGAPRDGRGRT